MAVCGGMSTLEEHLRDIIMPVLDESLCIFEKRRCNSFTNVRVYPSIERRFLLAPRGEQRSSYPVGLCRILQLIP